MSRFWLSPALAVGFLLTATFLTGCPPQKVQVPSVVGLTQVNAQGLLTAAGLSVGTVTQEHSDSVPVGNVISQDPAATTLVDPGTSVDLVISSGPNTVNVPNVVGQTQAGAQTILTDAGLTVGTVTQQSSDAVASGLVISQDPTDNTAVAPGTAVDLVLSTGPANVSVPGVVGQPQAAAEAAITAAGLAVGTVTQQSSDSVPAGNVISQNPEADTSVAPGTPVDLVVSTGPAVIAIGSASDLQLIGSDAAHPLDGNYVLTSDIDAAAKGGLGFTPIGTSEAPFTGTFDGQGHAILNLSINVPDGEAVGLFAYVGEFGSETVLPSIANVVLNGGTVTGRRFVGALVGYGGSGTISNCEVSATVNGADTVGGLIGFCAMDIDTCDGSGNVSYNGPVDPNAGVIGGLIGSSATQSDIADCTSSGVVSGPQGVGGLAGGNGGTLTRCFSSATVAGTSYSCGGLVGGNNGLITRCVSTGPVTGSTETGGLVGRSIQATGITQSYAISNVTVTAFGGAGGLVGFNFNAPVTESFAEGNVTNTSPWGGNGGLIGILGGTSVVQDCYARGTVSGTLSTAALVGIGSSSPPGATLINCYATGLVTSGEPGGLIAYFDTNFGPTVTNCFWDVDATGVGFTFENAGTGLGTAALQTAATYTNAGWNFDTTWTIVSGYPVLRWLQNE